MGRPPAINPKESIHTFLPKALHARITLLLYSEVDGRVPLGAMSEFLTKVLQEYFENKPLDLGPFLNELPGVHVISGPVRTLSALIHHLKGESK